MSKERVGSILDPIHAELSPLIWDNPAAEKPILKPIHSHWIKREIYKVLDDAGYTDPSEYLSLCLTGSLTTYQYSPSSDVDISLFIDSVVFPEWSRAELISLMVEHLDGKLLPGTPFPLQDFVVSEGIKPSDLYKPGLRSAYNIDNDKWIVPPEKDRAHDPRSEEAGSYAFALQQADKMSALLRYEKDKAVMFWHQIHAKRQRDMVAGKGEASQSNLVYKMLSQRGLIPEIAAASGEYIASAEKPPHLRESEGEKACFNCWAFKKGHCEMFGGYKVKEDQVCDDWESKKHESKTSHMQEAKFVYDPTSNRLLLGEMGRSEGENFTHNQLLEHPIWKGEAPPVVGSIRPNGYAETRSSYLSSPNGRATTLPWPFVQRRAEQAILRAVPGARFTNPQGRLRDDWELPGDPEVHYIGQPPAIQEAPDTEWDFQQ